MYRNPELIHKKTNSRVTLRGSNDEKIVVTIDELNKAYREWASTIHLMRQMKKNTTMTREEFLRQPGRLTDILNMID